MPILPPSYCTRPEWSSPGESMWMRLSKFAWCNRLPLRGLIRLFAPSKAAAIRFGLDLRVPNHFRLATLANHLEISPGDIRRGFCVDGENPWYRLAYGELRYCPTCLMLGFHSSLFQWPFLRQCPVHAVPLQTGCPRCRRPIAYRLNSSLALSPLSCAGCKMSWVPELERPAGRCQPLQRLHRRKLIRWQTYIGHALGTGGFKDASARDPRTGRYLALEDPACRRATLERFGYITTLNTLYPVPPEFSITRAAGSVNFSSDFEYAQAKREESPTHRRPTWHRSHWLGYTRFFIHLESIVAGLLRREHHITRKRRKAIHGHLQAGPAVPAGAVTEQEVVAICARMSWFGVLNPSCIFQRPRRPAFGLAAWLAYLPPRPFHLDNHEWEELVENWLWEDVRVSIDIWRQVAQFMKAHRNYYFHPALVPLGRLAGRYRSDRFESTEILSID